MKEFLSKAKGSTFLYVIIFAVGIAIILQHELSGRFISPYRSVQSFVVKAPDSLHTETITVSQFTASPVDTVRAEFDNIRNGITDVRVWQNGSSDTLSFKAQGHYYPQMRVLRFANDGTSQLILIPNTEHDIALGVGDIIYVTPENKLKAVHLESPNVGDIDSNGTYEVFSQAHQRFEHLNTATGTWE